MFWEKLNTQVRDVCLAIQIKNNSHFRFRSLFSFQKRLFGPKFSQLAWKVSFKQFLLVALLLLFLWERNLFLAHFSGKFPALDRSLFFYLILLKKTLLLTKGQWISMEDVAQIIFVFFLKRKNPIYSLIQREIPYCRLEQSLIPLALIAHSTLFSFPLPVLRLREVDFIGCY